MIKIDQALPCLVVLALLAACNTWPGEVVPPTTAAPSTDIYLGDLVLADAEGALTNIRPLATGEGYDNQPAFLPGGNAVYYVSAGPSGKTDIWLQDLSAETPEQITNTPERSEYSPRDLSGSDAVSFIRETPTGDTTHAYKLEDGTELPLSEHHSVGYYALLNQNATMLVFFRSEPARLERIDLATGEVDQIAENIGRALYAPLGNETAFFTIADEAGTFQVHRYSDTDRQSTPLFNLVGGSQDYAVFELPGTDHFGFLCADGATIYFRTEAANDGWRPIGQAEIAKNGVISRIAINDQLNRIAFVTEPVPEN